MANLEFERPRVDQVLDDIFSSYATQTSYELVNESPQVGVSSGAFANDRRDKVYPLIAIPEWTSQRRERDSYLSEWVVMLGLKKTLSQQDLYVKLAPPYLEIGSEGRNGVDLIASRTHPKSSRNIPIFAVNVKLQRLRNNQRAEIYKYDNVLGCPAIELSLGDFSIQTKKSGNVAFVPWLRQVATPNITNSGRIPDFSKWQTYLIQKVAGTISHYMVKTEDYIHGGYHPSKQEANIFPETPEEFNRFYDNLSFTYLAFKELCEAKDIKIM
jgi:hypothetical protein